MSSLETQQKLLVYGFVRDSIHQYAMDMPIELIELCFVLFYEMVSIFEGENTGYYEWIILDQQLIDKILNAKTGEGFESEIFELSGLNWRIQIYSNGYRKAAEGSCVVYLELVSKPSPLDRVVISFAILLKQTMTSWTNRAEYTEIGQSWGFPNRVLSLSDLKQLDVKQISIFVSIKIKYLVLNTDSEGLSLNTISPPPLVMNVPSKSQYSFQIEDNIMNMMRNCKNGRQFESEIFDNMWRLSYRPNGRLTTHEGYWSVYLTLCILPPFIQSIQTRYTIKCKQTDESFSEDHEYILNKLSHGNNKWLKSKQIADLESISFIIDIDILKVSTIDPNDNPYHIHDQSQIQHILSRIMKPEDQKKSIRLKI